MKFAGFTEVYAEIAETDDGQGRGRRRAPTLPDVARGRGDHARIEIEPEQHFTQPPPRFSEASLVKELEEKGIGRPSTYAAILSTISGSRLRREEGGTLPPDRARHAGQRPARSSPSPTSSAPTSPRRWRSSSIRSRTAPPTGSSCSSDVLHAVQARPRKGRDRDARRQARGDRDRPGCEKCGKPMVIKWGRNGHFLACSATPSAATPRSSSRTPTARRRSSRRRRPSTRCARPAARRC